MSTGKFVIGDCPFEESGTHPRAELWRCPSSHVAVARLTIRVACAPPHKPPATFRIARKTLAAVACALVFLVAVAACTAIIASVGYLNNQVIQRMQSAYGYRAQGDSFSKARP